MTLDYMRRAGLLLSGLVAVGFGAALLFFPHAMHASNGVDLGGNASLLSEVRAPGGALGGAGLLIAAGAFVPRLTLTSAVLSTLLYFAYGLSRVFSWLVDGEPALPLQRAMLGELAFGVIGALLLHAVLRADEAHRAHVGDDVHVEVTGP